MSRDVRKGHRRGRSLEDKDPRASTKAQHDNGGKNDSKRTRNASQTQHEMSNRIISTLLSEFTEHAQRKIEEIMKLGTVSCRRHIKLCVVVTFFLETAHPLLYDLLVTLYVGPKVSTV